jgi:hypothetical protein
MTISRGVPATGRLAFSRVDLMQRSQFQGKMRCANPSSSRGAEADDASGNLYVEGANTRLETTVFGVLRRGQQNFTNFAVNGPISIWGLAWARNNLVVGGYELSSEDAAYIYQVRVSGSSGTIVRKILVDGFRLDYGITIKDGYLLMTMDAVRIGRFYYPSGREAGFGRRGRHGGPGGDFVPDETISVAPRA